MEKETADMRGRQSSIARLLAWDREGFWHMLLFRILLVVSLITGIAILISVASGPQIWSVQLEALFIVLWLCFTMQVYETAKAGIVIVSRGAVYGHLNKSFAEFGLKRSPLNYIYGAVPPLAVAVWLAGFVFFLWLGGVI